MRFLAPNKFFHAFSSTLRTNSINLTFRRCLSIHEYLSVGIMRQYNIPTPKGGVATSAEEAKKICERLLSGTSTHATEVMVKAQVLAGGRAKGKFSNGFCGGVHTAKNPSEAAHIASKMLGSKLITRQTGNEGKPCEKVFITEKISFKKMYYVGILLDRQTKAPLLVTSDKGGTEIEEVAASHPSSVKKYELPVLSADLPLENARRIAKESFAITDEKAIDNGAVFLQRLFRLFVEKDATLVEINPLVLCDDGQTFSCLDAKFNFDDNASFRQTEVFSMHDDAQDDARERDAATADLNYVGLEGSIGCLVNGAGLAMATMDLIKLHGGEPANFLDVGGSATAHQVTLAFKIISGDSRVRSILVNIFGGIMRCDTIAAGIVEAMQTLHMQIPVVVRLQGTNAAAARKMIENSGLKLHFCPDLDAAAVKAIELQDSGNSLPKTGA